MMDLKDNMDKLAGALLTAVLAGFAVTYLLQVFTGIGNFLLYFIICFVFVATFFLFYKLSKKVVFTKVHIILLYLAAILLYALSYFGEKDPQLSGNADTMLRHIMPSWLFLPCILGFAYCVVQLTQRPAGSLAAADRKGFRLAVTGFSAVWFSVMLYTANLFIDNLYHIHAYDCSIINAFFGAPYNEYNKSIYGHYAIFYLLPVKLMHLVKVNPMTAIILTIAGFGFLSFVLNTAVLSRMVKNDLTFALAVIAELELVNHKTVQYYQLTPHRLLFPAAMTLLILVYLDKKKISYLIWVVGALAMVWNFETGMVACVCWAFVEAYDLFFREKKKFYRVALREALMLLLSFHLAYLIVGVYNLMMGGEFLSYKMFLYPYLSGTYGPAQIMIPLPSPLSGNWFWILAFLLANFLYVLACHFVNKELNKDQMVIMAVSILSLGNFVYYINRATIGNLNIVYFAVLILLAYWIDFLGEMIRAGKEEKRILIWFRNLGMCSLCILVLFSLTNIKTAWQFRMENSWKDIPFNTLCGTIKSDLPEDTACLGKSSLEIFAHIDKDPKVYTLGWTDMKRDTATSSYAYQQAAGHEYIFTAMDIKDRSDLFDDYEPVKQYDYGEHFILYRRTGQ